MDRDIFSITHDNSHDVEHQNYAYDLLYYNFARCGPEGGHLELGRRSRGRRDPSLFNRLVLMATGDKTWHSVNAVKANGTRRCISNYYFSPHSPNGYETTHVTYFMARPEQKLRRFVTKIDSEIRSALRKLKKGGFGKDEISKASKRPDAI